MQLAGHTHDDLKPILGGTWHAQLCRLGWVSVHAGGACQAAACKQTSMCAWLEHLQALLQVHASGLELQEVSGWIAVCSEAVMGTPS